METKKFSVRHPFVAANYEGLRQAATVASSLGYDIKYACVGKTARLGVVLRSTGLAYTPESGQRTKIVRTLELGIIKYMA